MPLFFIIAIGAGAITLGATTVDVTHDVSAHRRAEAQAYAQQGQQQALKQQAYVTLEDCQRAALAQGLPATSCQAVY